MPRAVLILAALAAACANATTFAPVERTDPIGGDKVQVQEIVSYGSYIYQWPSKFDLVYWPFTDEAWIWFCPVSGYAAFGSDFDKLTPSEKDRLKEWLKANYNRSRPPRTYLEKLAWLEKVYAARQMSDDFWRFFYRLAAYAHRDDEKTSLAYVRKELALLERHLASNPTGLARIETLYLQGEYHRRMGDLEKAREFFAQAKTAEYEAEDKTKKTGHPYFLKLIQAREELMSGKAAPPR